MLQEGGDGAGELCVPQGQQVGDCLVLLLGTSQPREDGFHAVLHLLVGFDKRAEVKESEVRVRGSFGNPKGAGRLRDLS